jgi:glycogen(starch) synthase
MRGHVADVFEIGEDRVTVIPNGIDCGDLHPVDDLAALRLRFAAPDERLVLLVGRLVYEKGFQLALDALPQVIRRSGRVRFLVAGSGTHEAQLRKQARKLGLMQHGTFEGWIGDDGPAPAADGAQEGRRGSHRRCTSSFTAFVSLVEPAL